MDMFDTVAANERGAWVHLTNMRTQDLAYAIGEDGEEDKSKPIRIKVLGPDSKQFRDKSRRRAAEMLKKRSGKLDFKKMSQDQILAIIDETEDGNLSDLITATIKWENITLDNKPVKCTEENSKVVYERYPAIKAQVLEFMENQANFFTQA